MLVAFLPAAKEQADSEDQEVSAARLAVAQPWVVKAAAAVWQREGLDLAEDRREADWEEVEAVSPWVVPALNRHAAVELPDPHR
jgi:hypothetical protein